MIDWLLTALCALLYISIVGFFPVSYIAFRSTRRVVEHFLDEEAKTFTLSTPPRNEHWKEYYGDYHYALHVVFCAVISIAGVSMLFMHKLAYLHPDVHQAMRYGFLGAYLFSLQMIYRRYSTNDLRPEVYLYCAFVLLAGLVFTYVAFQAITNTFTNKNTAGAPITGTNAGVVAVVAFSLGYFPTLAVRWFNRLAHKALNIRGRRANEMPLAFIDGISALHEARLRDNGIDNVQNLAACSVNMLQYKTPFNFQELMDWVDQAVLYVHLTESDIDVFRHAGIRTLSDFHAVWPPSGNDAARSEYGKEVAAQLQTTTVRLDVLHRVTLQGPNSHWALSTWGDLEKDRRERQHAMRKLVEQSASRMPLSARDVEKVIDPQTMREARAVFSGGEFAFTTEFDAEELYRLGWFYASEYNYGLAATAYEAAIADSPDHPYVLNDLAWLYAREYEDDETRLESALEYINRAIALSEKEEKPGKESSAEKVRFLNTRIAVQLAMRRYDDAAVSLAAAEEAVKTCPETDPETLHWLEWHRRKMQENL